VNKYIVGFIASVMLALPGVASAHTGSVACTKAGVEFNYNANFAHTTTVTENVNGTTDTFIVPAYTAVTHTVVTNSPNVIAGASWKDGTAAGSIPFTALTGCGTPPPPTPPTCNNGSTFVSFVNGVLTCQVTKEVQLPAPPPVTVTNTVYVPVVKWKTKIVVKHHTKYITRIKLVEWCPIKPKPRPPGVAG